MVNRLGFFIFSLVFSVLLLSLASAQTISQDINSFIDGFTNVIRPIAELLVGSISGSGSFSETDVLWSKVLFLILIFSVVFVSTARLDFFTTSPAAHFIFTAVIALLATRWIGDASIIQAILLPYSALGVAISAALPFVVWFLIVNVGMKEKAPSIRRLGWIFFGVVFLVLWFSRGSELTGPARWIYPLTFLAAIIMAWADGTIKRFWLTLELERISKASGDEAKIELERKFNEIDELVSKGVLTPAQAAERRATLRKRIKWVATRS